ncbi:hypothetical protein CIPAW_01G067000 [Carya illinoinensis]|uniref:Uncharacterized protein n=1 Tax=Carya illinoinensis TaxID=32201 RepID=A0A8T1RJ96_CARIL|nr:hypothetical protein CIPAW_01G067000 [Carya illinoinensis]
MFYSCPTFTVFGAKLNVCFHGRSALPFGMAFPLPMTMVKSSNSLFGITIGHSCEVKPYLRLIFKISTTRWRTRVRTEGTRSAHQRVYWSARLINYGTGTINRLF